MDRVWGPRPLLTAVVEVLSKKGPLTDEELLRSVRELYGELSFRELNSALMKLEIGGLVRVSRHLKDKRLVELVAEAE